MKISFLVVGRRLRYSLQKSRGGQITSLSGNCLWQHGCLGQVILLPGTNYGRDLYQHHPYPVWSFLFRNRDYQFHTPKIFANTPNLEALGHSGEVEIRAQYGGFFFAAGLSQFDPFLGWIESTTSLAISLVIFGGLILGRLGAILFDGSGGKLVPMIQNLYLIDAAGALLFATGLYLLI